MAIPEDLPLAGIRVAEFGQFIAAPGAAMMLADLGADVIKVEPLRGDSARRFDGTSSQSPMFLAYNRGKRGMALDLRQPAGAEAARRLAFSCDVVLHNARPGTMESIGLDAATLRTAKPALIHASVTGFGTRGPSRLRPGLDIAAQAESGMMSVTGEAGGQPLKAGFALIDAATALATSNAILAALFRRLRTGQGETIETSLLTVGIQLQAQLWSEYQCSGALPVRSGNSQPKAGAGGGCYRRGRWPYRAVGLSRRTLGAAVRCHRTTRAGPGSAFREQPAEGEKPPCPAGRAARRPARLHR
jgi:crotonobetainyl-CoA:carnitine CoA-transferase CaiB-like acyl-CoA transferase